MEEQKEKQIVLLDDEVLDQIVRTEKNIERWANFIFPHTRAKNLDQVRIRDWKLELPDGREAIASLSVEPVVGTKAYTCRTYDVYLAIEEIWYDLGMPEEPFNITLTKIAKKMLVPMNGKWAKRIYDELNCLFKTVMCWKLSYHTKTDNHSTVKNQRILETFDYDEIKDRYSLGDRFKATCVIRLDQRIRDNLRSKQTIPVNWTARKSIKSQIARVEYGRIDNILATQVRYERTGLNLLDDLQISDVSEYEFKSRRKRLVEMLAQQLNGKTLSTGDTLKAVAKETAGGEDWKLCCDKTRAKRIATDVNSINKRLPIVNREADLVEYLVDTIASDVGAYEENYRLYKKIAQRYSQTLILRALAEYKEEYKQGMDGKHRQKFFTIKLHAVAHNMGKEWIKACDSSCRYRPENSNLSFKL